MSSGLLAQRRLRIQRLRARLDGVVAYRVTLARLAGDAVAGLVLSQLVYWADKGQDEDGWVYKRQHEWEQELAISRSELETARKILLKKHLIQYKVAGCPPRGFYKLNLEALEAALSQPELNKRKTPRPGETFPEKGPTCAQGSAASS